MAAKRLLAFGLLWDVVIAGSLLGTSGLQHAQRQSSQVTVDAPRRLQGRFLHITDIHPDEFYRVHASTAEEDACHRGSGPAGAYGAETSDCDSPFSLVNATFDWIADNLKDEIDFVIWTGDSARHDSDEQIPRSPAQVLGTNRWVTSKFIDTFSDPKTNALAVPIIPTLGNNDILPHNILLPGPNKWLQHYTGIWRPFIPEEQRHSFEFGGWFYVEVIPDKLAVFSLNTLYFFDRNAGVDDCAKPSEPGFKQMEWLRIQLEFMRRRGVKAILMGHVPPARTDSKTLWDETCWQKYTLWLRQFRDVVVGGVYGHMNIDHFLLQDTQDINVALIGAEDEIGFREAMEDEMSVESTTDYLQELRAGWSRLPNPLGIYEEDSKLSKGGKKGKGDTKKELGGRWAERYQLSLISPSIVPNYFPTLRIVEYNISGLENAIVWSEYQAALAAGHRELFPSLTAEEQFELLNAYNVEPDEKGKKRPKDEKKKKKKKEPEKDKDRAPKDPNLVIPNPPPKSSPPGPAYSAQPLTFLGYTQYFANLTHINNDMTADGDDEDVESRGRWREGKHGSRDPKDPGRPKPRKFMFEVEYSTLDDEIYNLADLTVHSFVKLAYQIGQAAGAKGLDYESELGGESDGELEEHEQADGPSELKRDVQADKKHKRYDGEGVDETKKGKKADKVWLHFLSHAFVSSVDKDELRKL